MKLPLSVKPDVNAQGVYPVKVYHIVDADGVNIAKFSNFSNLTGDPLPAEENARIAAEALNAAIQGRESRLPAPGSTVHRLNADGSTSEYIAAEEAAVA